MTHLKNKKKLIVAFGILRTRVQTGENRNNSKRCTVL